MAFGGPSFTLLRTKLISSFVIPDKYRAMGMARCSENKMWIKVFNWPMVILVDSSGNILCRYYVFKESKRIIENSSTVFQDLDSWGMEAYRISPSLEGGCLVLGKERRQAVIKEVTQSGRVSTVIAGLERYAVDGVAYQPMTTQEKGKVLFGDCSKGLCSVSWPRGFLSGLFSSPVANHFSTDFDNKRTLCIDVARNSDLHCLSDMSGKIIIFNRQGQNVSEYMPEVEEEFVNQCVLFDHTGCIIVHNLHNNCIFRIAPDGHIIQTLFPEIKETGGPKFCESCNHSTIPTCRECRDNVSITAVAIERNFMWVARLSGEVEIFELQ